MKFGKLHLSGSVRGAAVAALLAGGAAAADRPQWGEAWSRNMVSAETGLPAGFNPDGEGVKWSAALGSETHSSPVIANGRVLIGTNNENPRDPKHAGDRGVLMCFDETNGELLWQSVVPKRDEDRFFDWPLSGMSSPATAEGERVYIVNNRGDLMCLDLDGLADGNDGPFRDEARYMTPAERDEPPALGPLDADIIWVTNLTEEAGIWSHDAAHSSVLIRGPLLYLNSGTGVDNTHRKIRRPEAPSLLVVDKESGRIVGRESPELGIGPNIFHSTWSAPSLAQVGGRDLLIFAAGNGIIYAFEPMDEVPPNGAPLARLDPAWSYDIDPSAPKSDVHTYNSNRLVGPSNFFGMPVAVGDSIFAAGGGDLWWGKNDAWLVRIEAAGSGDVTSRAERWRFPLHRHVMATPAVDLERGLVFIGDTGRTVYCVNAATGEAHWSHDVDGEVWASPLLADGKVWFATRTGHVLTFAASAEKSLLHEIRLKNPISATPTAANGTLYIATMDTLYAVGGNPPRQPVQP